MSVYATDILSRLPQLFATYTAIFGSELKIDSRRRCAGNCRELLLRVPPAWCTNVSNERDEVLIYVLTESEGLESLRPMATGVIQRFA